MKTVILLFGGAVLTLSHILSAKYCGVTEDQYFPFQCDILHYLGP